MTPEQVSLMGEFLPAARREAVACAGPGLPKADLHQEAMLAVAEAVQTRTGSAEIAIATGVRIAQRVAALEAALAEGVELR
jgi:hypothetical protein